VKTVVLGAAAVVGAAQGVGTLAARGAALRAARGAPQLTAGVRGFASEAHLERHFAKHASEWGAGNVTKIGYAKRAESLLRSPVGGDIQGFTSKQGWTFRYNSRTNEFATMKPDGTIETLFRPSAGASYWADQVGRYGP
jgi:pyocin large subunit-like protein